MRVFFLAFFLAGCMNFDWSSGKLACGIDDDCPSDMSCVEEYCVQGDRRSLSGSDSSSEISTPTDTERDTETSEDTGSSLPCGESVCTPKGNCDAVQCDDLAGTPSCIHQADVTRCPEAECGQVSCNDQDFSCQYVPVDEHCWGEEECLEASCSANTDGDPPECTTWLDHWLCDPGYTCSESSDFKCEKGNCFAASTGEEIRLSPLSGRSYDPTVAKSDDGFAVAWVDDVNIHGYGNLYFERLDKDGELVADSTQVTSLGTSVRYPVLLYLGYNRGFAVVHQGWKAASNRHEIYLIFLNQNGGYKGAQYLISDDEGANSRYPAAAFHESSNGVGIVWSDDRNKITETDAQTEVYATVFDVQEKYLVAGNQRITETINDEYWPSIVATEDGFVAAMHRKNDNVIATRKLGTNGVPLAGLVTLFPAGKGTRPIALARGENNDIGIVWRDTTVGQPRVAFGLLDDRGVLSSEPVFVGGALFSVYYQQEKFDYVGGVNLAWDTVRNSFVVVWDTIPGGASGLVDSADIFLTCIGNENGLAESPWRLSFNDNRSILPRFAMKEGVGVVVWHDNRNEVDPDTLIGEVYKSTFSSNK